MDASGYVGLPFAEHGRDRDGLDCWGLVRLAYAEQYGVLLPSYAEGYATTTDREEIPKLVSGEIASEWEPITPGEEQEGDVVLLRVLGRPIHVGLILDPPRFLHVMQGVDACVQDYQGAMWNRRVLGFYRYRGRP
jgi:cell wall-associated NlpC family hydrolase